MVYKKDTTLGQTKEFDAQIQVGHPKRGLGFRVWGLGFRVWFGVSGLGFRV